ncbi:MAG: aminoglycoside phosphotransferase family protein [Lachnospiraceae bacterium]|nr:aminoglycoside phosphotransferase family protein [Lachnospiraceae bacterium]
MSILNNFKIRISESDIPSESILTGGHINNTSLISLGSGKYILQSINRSVFQDINILEKNIHEIKKCFENHSSDTNYNNISIPGFIETSSGDLILKSGDNAYRLYTYISEYDTDKIDLYDRIKISAFAFGRYINIISKCTLKPAIPGYHNPDHYSKLWHTAFLNNPASETTDIPAQKLWQLENIVKEVFPSDLPMRNIHGDASIKNILIKHPDTFSSTIIDLDTCCPGYVASDYGDLVRSSLDLIRNINGKKELYDDQIRRTIEVITSEYLKGTDGLLTKKEIHSLIPGIIRVDCELAMRYLTDAISPISYFKKTPSECLERATDLINDAYSIIRLKDQLSLSNDF